MKLIVGLGNYGKEYDNTRHNIGFRFIDAYLSVTNVVWKNKFKGLYCEKTINNEKVIFLKPQTYMNLSGESVILFVNYFKIKIEDILVISDDLSLPIGTYRLRSQGSAGGHNGLKNIEECLKSNKYNRLRIGINSETRNTMDQVSFVLSKFTNDEEKRLIELEPIVNNIINDYANKNFDLIISRAGGTTIAEVIKSGVPLILVPSPYVKNDHQRKNANKIAKFASVMIAEENDDLSLQNALDYFRKFDNRLKANQDYKNVSHNNVCKKAYEIIKQYEKH